MLVSHHCATHTTQQPVELTRRNMDNNMRCNMGNSLEQVKLLCQRTEVDTVKSMALWSTKKLWVGRVGRSGDSQVNPTTLSLGLSI